MTSLPSLRVIVDGDMVPAPLPTALATSRPASVALMMASALPVVMPCSSPSMMELPVLMALRAPAVAILSSSVLTLARSAAIAASLNFIPARMPLANASVMSVPSFFASASSPCPVTLSFGEHPLDRALEPVRLQGLPEVDERR